MHIAKLKLLKELGFNGTGRILKYRGRNLKNRWRCLKNRSTFVVTLVVGVQRASRFEDSMTDGASVVAGEVLVLDMVDQGGFGGAYLSTGHTLVGVLLSSPDTIFNILSVDGVDTFHICRDNRLMMLYSLPPPVIHRFRVEKSRLCSYVVP